MTAVDSQRNPGLVWAVSAALVIVTALAYLPVLSCGYVSYDDPTYVIANSAARTGFSLPGVAWAFTGTLGGFWQPVTALSHMLDCQLFGLNPGAHHAVNLLLHLANVLLLFALLRRMTGALWPCAFAAALFALHPMNVESVAWIAERKTLLCMLFWLAGAWFHIEYAAQKRFGPYLLTLGFMLLALMSKPMAVTFPFALLLLDYWPLQRKESFVALIVEKLPLFAFSVVFGVLTYATQSTAGAVVSGNEFPLSSRMMHVLVNYVRYLEKLIVPTELSVLYPQRVAAVPPRVLLVSLLLLSTMTAAAFRFGAHRRWLLVGWLWFVGTMLPMVGIVSVGYHSIADRFVYLPAIGLFVTFAWALAELVNTHPNWRIAVAASVAAVLLALGAGSNWQARYWHDSMTLFSHAAQVTRNNFIMHENLGREYAAAGRMDDAIAEFTRAIEANPACRSARANLAAVLYQQGRQAEALALEADSAALFPDDPHFACDFGIMLADAGRKNEAIAQLTKATLLDPDSPKAHFRLAMLLVDAGRVDEARPHVAATVRLKPDFDLARSLLERLSAQRPSP